MENIKIDKWKLVVGIILTPLTFVLFLADRFVLVFMPHIQMVQITKWFDNTKLMGQSLLRVGTITIIIGIIAIVKWMM